MADNQTLAWPKLADKPRLTDYSLYDKIYAGDQYEAFSYKGGDKEWTKAYDRLRYIVANFAGLMSRVMADMLFGEQLTIDLETNQDFVDELMEQNQLITQLYESALTNSRRGDSIFKIRVGKRNINDLKGESTIIMEELSPAIYFPEFDNNNARFTPAKDILVWMFQLDNPAKYYLHKESHTPGYITHEIFEYNPKEEKIIAALNPAEFGFLSIEETKVSRSLIFHIPNVRDGNGFFGTSDYKDLISLFVALNNRLTKTDNILDKHSDPILAVPPGVLDEDGKVKKSKLGLFEVDNENPGFNKPEYIVWNANLDAAEKEIDRLIDLLFMFSEIAPATMGADKNGVIESGRALKFKLLATLRKRNRKKRYYDQAIKDMLQTAQDLAIAHSIKMGDFTISKSERPTIDWGDGVINDDTEMVDTAVKRVDAGLSSRADEIVKLDGKTPSEAKDKVKEIDKENAADLPPMVTVTDPKTGKPMPQPMPQINKMPANQPVGK